MFTPPRCALQAHTILLSTILVAILGVGQLTAFADVISSDGQEPVVSVPHHVGTPRSTGDGDRPTLPSERFGIDLSTDAVVVTVGQMDAAPLIAEDEALGELPMRIGVNRPLGFSSADSPATLVELPGVGTLWSATFASPGAQALRLRFSFVDLPSGAELWIYAPDEPQRAQGPERGQGPWGDGEFWSGAFLGDELRVEYFEPENADGAGAFLIEEIGHIYRGLEPPVPTGGGGIAEGDCHNDVLCYAAWLPLHNATARMNFTLNGFQYLCSGTLLNTEISDETPYFLTANHCIPTTAAAHTLTCWWFYQTESCDGANAPYETSFYANLLETSTDTDISLLMIKGALPDGVTWAGWDTDGNTNGDPMVSIHHPDGARKKISFGTKQNHPWGDNFHYFGVYWYSGTIEQGTSGAGLYRNDTDKHLVGVASHSADPIDCTNQDGPSGYGKFRRFYLDDTDVQDYLAAGVDDDYEDNDTCASAISLSEGTYDRLKVKSTDEDWFAINIPAGGQLDLTFFNNNNWGDIDLELYDGCGGTVVQARYGQDDDETMDYLNDSYPTQDFYLRVYMGASTRNVYDMTLAIIPPAYGVGDLNCDGAVNGFDIDPFVMVVGDDLTGYYALYPSCNHMLADCNEDGEINGFDIDPFVALIGG